MVIGTQASSALVLSPSLETPWSDVSMYNHIYVWLEIGDSFGRSVNFAKFDSEIVSGKVVTGFLFLDF